MDKQKLHDLLQDIAAEAFEDTASITPKVMRQARVIATAKHARRRFSMTQWLQPRRMLPLLGTLVIAILIFLAFFQVPKPVTAAEIVRQLEQAKQNPSSVGLYSFYATSTFTYTSTQNTMTSREEIEQWYVKPDKLRTVTNFYVGDALQQTVVRIVQGKDYWRYDLQDPERFILHGQNDEAPDMYSRTSLEEVMTSLKEVMQGANFVLLGTETLLGRPVYVLESTSSAQAGEHWLKIWIDQEFYIPLQREGKTRFSESTTTIHYTEIITSFKPNIVVDEASFALPQGYMVIPDGPEGEMMKTALKTPFALFWPEKLPFEVEKGSLWQNQVQFMPILTGESPGVDVMFSDGKNWGVFSQDSTASFIMHIQPEPDVDEATRFPSTEPKSQRKPAADSGPCRDALLYSYEFWGPVQGEPVQIGEFTWCKYFNWGKPGAFSLISVRDGSRIQLFINGDFDLTEKQLMQVAASLKRVEVPVRR